jgi:hypothetical protein
MPTAIICTEIFAKESHLHSYKTSCTMFGSESMHIWNPFASPKSTQINQTVGTLKLLQCLKPNLHSSRNPIASCLPTENHSSQPPFFSFSTALQETIHWWHKEHPGTEIPTIFTLRLLTWLSSFNISHHFSRSASDYCCQNIKMLGKSILRSAKTHILS